MDTGIAKHNTINPNFTLSAREEELLSAALNSNNTSSHTTTNSYTNNDSLAMAPGSLTYTESPLQAPGSGTRNSFESPFIDYDYEFDAEASFDYDFANDSQGQMIGRLPGTSSDGDGDLHEKRSHEDEDGDEEEGDKKRREGKKPGRKPLTSEPTSKRKAQNRAAQRAFRERKEKHLKDLETKVEDLEKASESANHENSILRAQIEKMTMELREYQKRLSLTGGSGRTPPSSNGVSPHLARGRFGNGAVNNPNDVSFQFEFPRFGQLPGPPSTTTPSLNGSRSSASLSSTQQMPSPVDREVSPRNQSLQYPANGSMAGFTQTPVQYDGGDMSSLSGLFSPSILESVSKSPPFEFFPNANGNNNNLSNGSTSSTDFANANMSTGHNTSYSSPSASSNSNQGPSSSCGTSPEPTMQSPVYNKPIDSTLTTIGEENSGIGEGELTFCDKLNMACGNSNNPIPRTMSEPGENAGKIDSLDSIFDTNGINWFAEQNGNQFDPQLFGDYREPQENILSGEGFSDDFFAEAFALPDFSTPFNAVTSPAAQKKDLVAQIEAKQNDDDEEVVPGEDPAKMLPCHTIWDRLQACPKVKEGELDMDGLCKDLQKKAKCSETGAVVNESDFNKIMKSYVEQKFAEKANKA